MKKLLTALLAAVMCLTGCGDDTVTYSTTQFNDYFVNGGDLTTWNWLSQGASNVTKVLTNIVPSMLETSIYGEMKGDLAESWTHNEDYSVWTFKLKQGQMWQKATAGDNGDLTYEDYCEITAHDFVAAMKWVLTAENASECYEMATSNIKNAYAYLKGEITDFNEVGIKAIDDYTVEYTCNSGKPYFDTILLYPSFFPAPQKALDEFGSKWGTDPQYIVQAGSYLLTNYQNETEKTLTANEKHWDYENTKVKVVKMLAVKDKESTKEYFERGELSLCDLAGTQPTAESQNGNPYMYRTDPIACDYTFFLNNQAADPSANAAINNLNFRLALKHGIDRTEYVAANLDPIDPESLFVYTYTPAGFVSTSDGTDYTQLGKLKEQNVNPYNPELAAQYMAKAKEELGDTVEWPVKLGWAVKSGNETGGNVAIVLKDTLETCFNGDVTLEILEWSSSTRTEIYEPELNGMANAGWIPDYGDPCNVLFTILEDGYMNNVTEPTMSGWDLPEFQAMYAAADAITNDKDARYLAFANAEAYLLENAYIIPCCQAGAVYRMSNRNEYTKLYSLTGGMEYRYKYLDLYETAITAEQHAQFKADWQAKRKELGLG